MKRLFMVAVIFLPLIEAARPAASQSYFGDAQAWLKDNYAPMPLAFTENRGQFGRITSFRADAEGAIIYFCPDEVVYLLSERTDQIDDARDDPFAGFPPALRQSHRPRYKTKSHFLKARFLDANPSPKIKGGGRLGYNNNYFLGNDPSRWIADVPNFSFITYHEIYPGIDLKFFGQKGALKYEFWVSPGADLSMIKIKYEGVGDLEINPEGDLQLISQPLIEKAPSIYQQIEGRRIPVEGCFEMRASGVFGFAAGNSYDPDYPLIIDPTIEFSTYFGGSQYDVTGDIAVDDEGCIYIIGVTESENIPIQNPYDWNYNGNRDIFVAKFSSTGRTLIYSTYIGGSMEDYCGRLTIDSEHNVYFNGSVNSYDYPTVNPYDDSYNGVGDAVVTKLSPEGNRLIYSTYLGGSSVESAYDIAIDRQNQAYVTGGTFSTDFPTRNAFDPNYNGGDQGDVFVAGFSELGSRLIYGTYLGGSSDESGCRIEVAHDGSLVIAGFTTSPDFPVINAYDSTYAGFYDAFISRFSPDGRMLLNSTFFGGSGQEVCIGMAINDKLDVYIVGDCSSTDMPLRNPFDSTLSGAVDGFIAEISLTQQRLVYSTYLGGSYWDVASEVTLDPSGNIYVGGWTWSDDFPVHDPIFRNLSGFQNCVISVFNPAGNELLFSTYYGGEINEVVNGIALDRNADIYFTGWTESITFPVYNAFDSTFNDGWYDCYLAKLSSATSIVVETGDKLPACLYLSVFPNPFNAQTTIEYNLKEKGLITLSIYNITGQKVATLFEGKQNAGEHQITWDAKDISSGIYFAKLETEDKSQSIRMTLLK